MKTLILYLSVTLFASLGLANAQSNEPQPAGQTIDGGPPKSQPGRDSPGRDPERSRAAYKALNARPVPAHVLYSFFFGDLVVSQRSAAEVKSRGKSDAYYQTLYSRQAGLTDDEGAILNQVALDWRKQQDAIEAETKAIIDARRAEPNPPKNLLTSAEFSQFGKAGIENAESHMEELKSSLGDTSFEKLDAYVKAKYQPSKVDFYPNPSGNHAPPKGAEDNGGPQ